MNFSTCFGSISTGRGGSGKQVFRAPDLLAKRKMHHISTLEHNKIRKRKTHFLGLL
jgi:hypothetical protein